MAKMICVRCGNIGASRTVTRGSLLIEIILWLMLIVPGIIYSIWRHTTKHKACRSCGSAELVPVDSPAGKALVERYHSTAPIVIGELADRR